MKSVSPFPTPYPGKLPLPQFPAPFPREAGIFDNYFDFFFEGILDLFLKVPSTVERPAGATRKTRTPGKRRMTLLNYEVMIPLDNSLLQCVIRRQSEHNQLGTLVLGYTVWIKAFKLRILIF